MSLSQSQWLEFCRRASHAARDELAGFESTAERGVETGRGEGGDMAYAIDRAAEHAIVAELELLGEPATVVSEELGEKQIAGGGPVRVVIDPVDGSLNAKRGLPFACVSIAVASGPRMGDVEVGFLTELFEHGGGDDWWALRGGGAFHAGRPLEPLEPAPLELLGLETARPALLAAAVPALAAVEARRVRAFGSVAMSLCMVAAGRLDAMVALRQVRSVDAAAAQLLVTEVGGAVALPDGDSLDLQMRSRLAAARDPETAERLLGVPAE
jgi:myo-inositol-1(or 4)-monophosphatase